MTGQWINVKFARQTRPLFYRVVLKLMSAEEDLVVSIHRLLNVMV